MLKAMRRHAKYFYVLFILVILSFIFWGVGDVGNESGGAQYVAEVGDEAITVQEFWSAYDRTADLYRDVYGAEFDPEKMRLRDMVLERLVDERVMMLAARELGITVSDEELQESIVSDPSFQRGGVFSRQVYVRALEFNRMTPTAYEELMRRELTLAKMRRLIEETVDLTPRELKNLGEDRMVVESLGEVLLESKKGAAVKAYINGLKKRLPIKVNPELVS